ncbi:MAG: tetratricopeptide repeat protein [Chromatiaceae bacterium]|nr:tetratricopeptide repeat protein [Chromatiaceae bacterium]
MRSPFSFYFSLLLLPSVAGCTGLSPRGDVQVFTGHLVKQEHTEDAVAPPAAEMPKLAGLTELTPDLIYAVLVGQVARQRGEHQMAFDHFLQAAQLAQDPGLAELAASAALTLDDTAAVQRAADAWLELSPNSIGAHQLAAYARLEANDVAAATDHLRRIIALAAEEGEDGYGQAARLVSKLKLPDRRLKLMETLTSEEPESADAWFARAIVAAGADRPEEAAKAARRALDLRPGWNQPRIFLVQLLMNSGDREKARETLEAFVTESPDDHGLRLLYAQLLVDEQEFSRARNVFEHMLRNTPKEPDVLFALGVLSLQLEDMEAARDYFVQLRDTGGRQDDSAYYLGQVEELADNLDTAVSWYLKVEGDQALDARIRIAQIRAEQGKVERAREILHQLRDQWPEDAPTIFLIEGATLAEVNRLREAMDVYDEALEAFPGNPDLLYARGLHALSLNRLDIMESDFRTIIAKDPNNADALNALGYSLADQTDRYTEALSYIERALALKPEEPAVLDSMGWVQFRLGKPEEALEYLRKALAVMPDAEIAAHLGEVLWALDRRDEARSTWEAALAKDPDNEYLQRVIGRYKFTRSDSKP